MQVPCKVTVAERAGVRALDAARRLEIKSIAQSLQVDDIVAVYTSGDKTGRRNYWLGQVKAKPRGVTDEEGTVTCPQMGEKFLGPRGRGKSRPADVFLELEYFKCASLAVRHDRTYIAEMQGGERLRYCVSANLLRQKVCSGSEWDGMAEAAPPAPTRRSARTASEPEPTAPVRPRRYELPLRMHQLIDTSIRDVFQDELFTHPGAEKDGEERNDTDDEGAGADE